MGWKDQRKFTFEEEDKSLHFSSVGVPWTNSFVFQRKIEPSPELVKNRLRL